MASILAPVSDTLSPLSASHRNGLIAVSTFGFLSFAATSTLFGYLTFKLIRWHINKSPSQNELHHVATTDLSLGLSQMHFGQSKPTAAAAQNHDANPRNTVPAERTLNQFLVLVYNLLFAEMHQSMAFMLNVSWTATNGIFVGTSTCWAQGWFVSTGDLAVSCFITAIAVHTYLTIVRGYKPPQGLLYLTIASLWVFVYALGIIGILITNNGHDGGGLYVRAVAWCWVNVKYDNLRLWLHYFWIFLCLALTSGLYILIFFSLQRRSASPGSPHDARRPSTARSVIGADQAMGTHPGFLVYPIIYGLCTAPLALFRVATMSGRSVSAELFCFAASMIASNGWLDVILFSWTRSSIIFAPSPDAIGTGLDTFAFIRTPPTRRYGNMVWVQGGSRGNNEIDDRGRNNGGWWRIGGDGGDRKSKSKINRWPGGPSSGSQESLRGVGGSNEIQMDIVTSVVIEVDRPRKESALSVNSSEKGVQGSSGRMHL
ncbi:putative Glucose receptor Git3 N-terminal domain-containing protein [Seiridium unicorne]|uniref:Glucose receptor Git3 N-terminal domain-containing protein n=1 Tax=Seiridium unicorne TaxID=138068 RepID=A0ABR2UYH0_9PEZI